VTLADLAPDSPARLLAVEGDDPLMLRLMEMGLVPGAPVCVKKTAPFGGPIQIQLRGYLLSIRRNEAKRLRVAIL
jgi:Fe2+ transport system protein FeoA